MLNKLKSASILGLALAAALATPSFADDKKNYKLLTTIKPIYYIVQAVNGDLNELSIINNSNISPHDYQPKPSDIQKIKDADFVFQIHDAFQPRMSQLIKKHTHDHHVISVADIDGLELLANELHLQSEHEDDQHDSRKNLGKLKNKHPKSETPKDHDHDHDESEAHQKEHGHAHDEKHDHKDHSGETHEEHKAHEAEHKDHVKHEDHAKHEEHSHDEAGHHGHDHGDSEYDLHIWLSLENTKTITNKVADLLKEFDPKNAAQYESNAADFVAKIDKLKSEVSKQLASHKGKTFFTYHDAFTYFTKEFGLNKSIALNPSLNHQLSAKKIAELIHIADEKNINCVMQEPQMNDKISKLIKRGRDQVKMEEWDLLGTYAEDGQQSYLHLIQNMANNLDKCLAD